MLPLPGTLSGSSSGTPAAAGSAFGFILSISYLKHLIISHPKPLLQVKYRFIQKNSSAFPNTAAGTMRPVSAGKAPAVIKEELTVTDTQ